MLLRTGNYIYEIDTEKRFNIFYSTLDRPPLLVERPDFRLAFRLPPIQQRGRRRIAGLLARFPGLVLPTVERRDRLVRRLDLEQMYLAVMIRWSLVRERD